MTPFDPTPKEVGAPVALGRNTPPGGLDAPRRPEVYSVGGTMTVKPLRQVLAEESEQARQRAEAANAPPVVQSLADHIRKFFSRAEEARRPIERRMLAGIRALRGEYSPDKLSQLRSQGSPEIYMMLFASKARQYKALLGDVVMGTGDDKPWTLTHTPDPTLPQDTVQEIVQGVLAEVTQAEMGGQPLQVPQIRQMLRDARAKAEAQVLQEARTRVQRAEKLVEDALAEGGFMAAMDQLLDDMAVFPTAFLKGPVMRRRARLQWEQTPDGWSPAVTTEVEPHWERCDPLNIYPAPWARTVRDGPLIERHRLTPSQLSEMIGVEGYSDDAIKAVLDEHGIRGLHEWLSIDSERAHAEGRSSSHDDAGDLIDALQFWGQVPGKLLIEWGLSEQEVPDPSKVFEVEAWLIDRWVIRAVINPDPLARRPYYARSFRPVPGSVWGESLHDTMRDIEDMCNAAARALAGNLGIASGPQIWANVDRLADGEEVTTVRPWRIWQTTSDTMGSSAAPMGFFQPSSNAAELMNVYDRFSTLADEYTGIPRYMTGDGNVGGAGRTASGMSMMVGNAGKTVKSAVAGIDKDIIAPVVERAYEHLMVYGDDPEIKGDLQVVARGALSLVTRESAQVRRNEFLSLALQSQTVQQLIGVEGLAALLRASAKGLDMDGADFVPSDSEIRVQQAVAAQQAQQMQQMQQMQQAQQAQGPQPPQQGPTGSAELANGAPVVDNFGA